MAKRKYFNGIHYDVDILNKRIILKEPLLKDLQSDNQFLKYKKIGGSTIPDILLSNQPFKSEFAAFCHIARLKLPILQPKYVNAGTILEPKIFDFLREKALEVAKAQQTKPLIIENFVAKDYGFDYFKGKIPYESIGGVPDGLLPEKDCILEVKTAGEKKREKWDKEGVDPAYLKQAQLYAYLNGNKYFNIVALFLQDNDYLHPELVDIRQRNFKIYPFKVNTIEVVDDIAMVEEWYKKYTSTNISPCFDNSKDADQIAYLMCKSYDEWEKLLDEWKRTGKAVADIEA
ncbi:hypothetical protein GE118_03480 [Mycoplasma sp. NEAQ87857]|uniref:MAGa7180 family putative nuclease n=1 Tax=Mycoplasma sp. NEAQ87857 TaxID=2683967 RepID=UPI001318AFD7|nr:hypothetical protein [Mycoplasma sp. NEAQ87857]QGZ97846.1 hypothetical protein GE118_03480 [Mycoplasma sp. NEAQ87857]